MKKPLLKALSVLGLLAAATPAPGTDLWQVYQIATESDPQLAAAAAGFQAAREVRPQSRAALLPQVNAGANLSRIDSEILESNVGDTGSTDYNSTSYSLTLSQALFRYGSWIQYQQSDSLIRQAEAQYGSAQQGLALRVSQAYFNVLAARDALEFARAEQRATQQQLRQTEQRFEVGLSAITDVHEARAGYDAAVAQEIGARNQLDVAQEALREITGLSFESLAPLQDDIPLVAPEPTDIDAWVETATDRNLELLAAAAATKVADQEIRNQRAGYYPTVDLEAQHSRSDNTDAPLFGRDEESNTISLQLSVPLYQGGFTSSRVREAHALYNQARQQLEQQRRSTISQTRQAYLNVVAGISQVRAREQAVESAQTALEATQAGFEVGTRTAVDVLNGQRELFRAKRDYAQSRYDYILSTLNLKQAAGTLIPEDIKAINEWLAL
ncbi:TolC family outer membrane protein [Thiohalomonas denitrificans]|uniref:TolC family outer membrane protein n=1 Tax=Thiohalomonas denitrificans TaxID=415747 RepID=UPI0026EAD866|nr:TolC family outer membrane protein [Thiohalomonas denitrificans]